MNVLSLFDGMSCGQIALNKLGIEYDNYYACEIDKHAITVTKKNYPDTIHLGDVRDINSETFGDNKIDLLIGGSPCQGFSFAGKQLNFDDPRSALFFEYVRLLKELKPKYFLLENVKMRKEYEDVITDFLGVDPIFIDSKFLTPQTRKRLYWTNIPNTTHPPSIDTKFDNLIEKTHPITPKMVEYLEKFPLLKQVGDKLTHPEATKKGYVEAGLYEGLDLSFPNSKTRRGRYMKDWSNCLTASSHDLGVVVEHEGKLIWRRFTPVECERFQTVPGKEVTCIYTLCLDQVKNYVNVVEKNPKLLKLALNAEKEELSEFVKFATSDISQKNPQRKYIVPQNVDMQTPRQINKCIQHNLEENNITVKNVEKNVMYKSQNQEEDFVPGNAFINITEGRITHFGKEGFLQKDNHLTTQLNGGRPLKLSGKEIMELVKDVNVEIQKNNNMSSIYTTLSALGTNNIELMLITLYLFVKNATIGYTQTSTNQNNISLLFRINNGYTGHVSDAQRYKMLGNGWTVDVIAHIFSNMNFVPSVKPTSV